MKRLGAICGLLGALLAVAAGCDDLGLFAGRTETGEDTRTLGVITLHAASTLDPQGTLGPASGSAERFTVEARFVRFDLPFESEVREVLGLADLDALPPNDECVATLRPAAPAPSFEPAAPAGSGVELLDVGRILVRGAGAEQTLAVRTFPDLLDVMSGVTYGGASDIPYQPGRRYDVRGDSDRTPWVSVNAPPGWDDLRVNGTAVRDGLVGTFDPQPQLDVRWIPWSDRSSDVVAVLFWTGPGGSPQSIVCHPADDGVFALPETTLAQLPVAPDLAGLTLRMERVVRVSFPLDRLDEAEAVFRVSLTTPVR